MGGFGCSEAGDIHEPLEATLETRGDDCGRCCFQILQRYGYQACSSMDDKMAFGICTQDIQGAEETIKAVQHDSVDITQTVGGRGYT